MSAASLPMHLLRLKVEGEPLTPKQAKILRRMAMGDSIEEAAASVGLQRETAKYHVTICRAKLGARNTTHAVAIAISLDLI